MTTGEQLQDLTRGAVPILIVIAAIYCAVQVGFYIERLSSGTSAVDQRFKQVEEARKADLAPIIDSIKDLRGSVEDIRKALQDPTSRAIPTDLVRLSDLYVFCLQMKIANSTLSLQCESIPSSR
jgi:hypothetical protein